MFSRILFFILIIKTLVLQSQVFTGPQTVSGVINSYTEVTAFVQCTDSVQVSSSGGFAVGDRVLVIQMQGARIDGSNTSSFGTITDIAGAGSYEFARIDGIVGNRIEFTDNLGNAYDPAGAVQMIRVPEYLGGVTLNGTVTAAPWNGTTGGVLAFDATDVIMNASIDVTGLGFRGGDSTGTGDQTGLKFLNNWRTGPCINFIDSLCGSPGTVFINCGNATQSTATAPGGNDFSTYCGGSFRNQFNTYCGCELSVPACEFFGNSPVFDSLNYTNGQNLTCAGCTGWDNHQEFTAEKGEGISRPRCGFRFSRGHIANGGGGGNIHNGGGAGGSNYGQGGNGGYAYSGVNPVDQPNGAGIGGVDLSTYYAAGRVFMGGGAGSGQGNDGQWTAGEDGGGIVFINATNLTSNGNNIIANGADNTFTPSSTNFDGSGGGGGGGAVVLYIDNFVDNPSVSARGGQGNDNIHSGSSDCYAPGGGGGGGIIAFKNAAPPAGLTSDVNGGDRGTQSLNTASCALAQPGWYTQDGQPGTVILNWLLNEAANTNCVLPVSFVELKSSRHDESIVLRWDVIIEDEEPAEYYLIYKGGSKESLKEIAKIEARREGLKTRHFYWDKNPRSGKNYYQVKAINAGGEEVTSNIVLEKVENSHSSLEVAIFPNPTTEFVTLMSSEQNIDWFELMDASGKSVAHGNLNSFPFQIDMSQYASGQYLLRISAGDEIIEEPIIKTNK